MSREHFGVSEECLGRGKPLLYSALGEGVIVPVEVELGFGFAVDRWGSGRVKVEEDLWESVEVKVEEDR
jgi:hypothetical protein